MYHKKYKVFVWKACISAWERVETCCLFHALNLMTFWLSLQTFLETRGLAGSHWLSMSFLPRPPSEIKTLRERKSWLESSAPPSPQDGGRISSSSSHTVRKLLDLVPNAWFLLGKGEEDGQDGIWSFVRFYNLWFKGAQTHL